MARRGFMKLTKKQKKSSNNYTGNGTFRFTAKELALGTTIKEEKETPDGKGRGV